MASTLSFRFLARMPCSPKSGGRPRWSAVRPKGSPAGRWLPPISWQRRRTSPPGAPGSRPCCGDTPSPVSSAPWALASAANSSSTTWALRLLMRNVWPASRPVGSETAAPGPSVAIVNGHNAHKHSPFVDTAILACPSPCQGKAPLGPRAIRKGRRFSRGGSVLHDIPDRRPASIPSVRDFPTAALLLAAPFLLRWESRAACPESSAVPLRFLGKLCLTRGQAHDKIVAPMKGLIFCAQITVSAHKPWTIWT